MLDANIFAQGQRRGEDSFTRSANETHFSAIEDPPCAYARLPCPDENRRRSQGPLRPAGQGSRPARSLTTVPASPSAGGAARYRLRGKRAFEAVFKTGARHDGQFLQLIAAPAAQAPGRVGYVIGRKTMRRAVDRNGLRRRLREVMRAARPAILAFDIVLRVKRMVSRADIAAAIAESRLLLARLALPR
jgi:ribonuclease P protein component